MIPAARERRLEVVRPRVGAIPRWVFDEATKGKGGSCGERDRQSREDDDVADFGDADDDDVFRLRRRHQVFTVSFSCNRLECLSSSLLSLFFCCGCVPSKNRGIVRGHQTCYATVSSYSTPARTIYSGEKIGGRTTSIFYRTKGVKRK